MNFLDHSCSFLVELTLTSAFKHIPALLVFAAPLASSGRTADGTERKSHQFIPPVVILSFDVICAFCMARILQYATSFNATDYEIL